MRLNEVGKEYRWKDERKGGKWCISPGISSTRTPGYFRFNSCVSKWLSITRHILHSERFFLLLLMAISHQRLAIINAFLPSRQQHGTTLRKRTRTDRVDRRFLHGASLLGICSTSWLRARRLPLLCLPPTSP